MLLTQRGPRYQFRTSLTVSVEADILQRTKDIATAERITMSEIVNSATLDFIERHESKSSITANQRGSE
jgi:hypothetical protein